MNKTVYIYNLKIYYKTKWLVLVEQFIKITDLYTMTIITIVFITMINLSVLIYPNNSSNTRRKNTSIF